LVRALSIAAPLVASGCLGDILQAGPGAPPPAAATRPGVASLWELAPADAVTGTVLHDGAFARLLQILSDADASTARDAFVDQLKTRAKVSFDPLSAEAWVAAGVDPQKGAASFQFADPKRGRVAVLPVVDRAKFRAAFQLGARVEDGGEVDVLDDGSVCEPAAGRYVCAQTRAAIAAAAAPHASELAASAVLGERGELELYMTRDVPGLIKLGQGPDAPGRVTEVTGVFHLRDDGATWHVHAVGALATPAARAFYSALAPDDLLASAKGVASLGRVHLDPLSLVRSAKDLPADLRTELVEQLTGDVEVLPGGPGFANATVILPLHDAARVEAFVKKQCGVEAANKEARPVGAFAVESHGCTAIFDTRKLVIPVALPAVPIALRVADGRLVVTIGDGKAPAAAPSADVPETELAKSALAGPATLLFYGHDLGIGPEVGAGAMFRAAVPLFGAKVAAAVDAWSYATAHIAEAVARVRMTDEEVDLVVELTGFAGDPPEARAAYRAALGLRFAGDEPGYRAALAAIEKRFPASRAARRAAIVRRGAPSFGAGAALLGTLGLVGNATSKKK
jgi:hypothetical protein